MSLEGLVAATGLDMSYLWSLGSLEGHDASGLHSFGRHHSQNTTKSLLCSDKEGWGPVAGTDLHLTHCFVEGVVFNVPVVVAVLFCLGHLISMYRRKPRFNPGVTLKSRLQVAVLWVQIVAAGYDVYTALLEPSNPLSAVTAAAHILASFIVLGLTMRERVHSNIASGSLLIYWLLSSLAVLIGLSSAKIHNTISLFVQAAAIWSSFALELVPRNRSVYLDSIDPSHSNPYDQANVFSRMTFTWMTPLMKRGYEVFLTSNDLPQLAASDRADHLSEKLIVSWDQQVEAKKKSPSLLMALCNAFAPEYMLGGLFKALQDSMAFVQPQLLRLLISFVEEYTRTKKGVPLTEGIYIAIGMLAVSILQTAFLHQYFERSFTTGMRVRTSLTSLIFRKSLRLSNEARSGRTTGDTVNLMSIDTQRLQDICPNGHLIWSAPFQIIICLYSLHGILGNAMWAGVIFMIILVPFNSKLAANQKVLNQELMKAKDLRTRLTSELFANIKSIKLYSWEKPFLSRLQSARDNQEMSIFAKMAVFGSFMSFLWTFAPFVVSCSTFVLYAYISDEPLTSDKVFPSIALFNLLQFPLAMFPLLINNWIQASVALKRVTEFLTSEELQATSVQRLPGNSQAGSLGVEVRDAEFVWKEEPRVPALSDVNLKVSKGELVCVVGRVGSGKSSLLQSLLGDLKRTSGEVKIFGSVAYVAQSPWIFNGSVKDNILFGLEYDESLYQETVHACALSDDLAALPDGDSTVVGEKGISLSGGQKARITLARAVYARADVYLLDDPLSAVDEHVGRHLIKHVLGPNGLLSSRAVILATNSIPVLRNAHEIIMLSGGKIIERSSYAACVTSDGKITQLLREFGNLKNSGDASEAPSTAPSTAHSPASTPQPESTPKPVLKRPRAAPWVVQAPIEARMEHVEQGKVSWNVYVQYVKVCGPFMVGVFIVCLLLAQTFSYGGNIWLKHWSELNNGAKHIVRPGFYLTMYGAIGMIGALFALTMQLVLWLGCSIRGAKTLHDNMLHAVIRAPMSFFETTPLGRIVNRFSNDVNKVDQQLGQSFYQLINAFARIFFTVVLIAFSTPIFLIFVFPLSFVYYWYQLYYLRTSRELKRLESVSKSPIFTQFQETLDGISTVRAYGQLDRFVFVNEGYLDGNNRAYFPSVNANRWLAVRLEFFGSIIIFASAVLAVLSLPSGRISAGMIGLTMSYALSTTQVLNWLVRMTVEVETNIVSVERMLEYSEIKPEAAMEIPGHEPPKSWPQEGAVNFDDFSCRYRAELPLVLKNISLKVEKGQKIGIVGRTGAGKSSLSLALFRIIEAASGHISIDRINTSTIGLHDLRSQLSIIPQDAQIFKGTVRTNLDPNDNYTDPELWRVLDISHLKQHVESMDGGLEAEIAEGGSNLSAGQKQLVCLARAMLTNSRILVLDEATASVDVETDKIVQQTIREVFKDRTILTIAHRLNTIIDSDKVVVLSYGEVKEFDSPQALLANSSSMFAALANSEERH